MDLIRFLALFLAISVPQQSAPYDPIVATCDAPEGAQILWESDPATQFETVDGGRRIFIWAPPGNHELRCDVFSVDWESKQFSVARHRAAFTVGGVEPTPTPTPPVGKLTAVIVHETEDDTASLSRAFVALRSGPSADWLKSQGHSLAIVDDDSTDVDGQPLKILQPLKALGVAMPALFVLDSTNRVVLQQTLPPDVTASGVISLIQGIK